MNAEEENWEIYRLELVFLNPEEYRWQMFQFWPGEPEKPPPRRRSADPLPASYGLPAQSLLRWVYNTATRRGFASATGSNEIEIDTRKIRERLLERIEAPDDSAKERRLWDFIDAYIGHTKKILLSEGLPTDSITWIEDIKRGHSHKKELNRRQAQDLISALFVAHNWDVYGRLSYKLPDMRPINASRISSLSYVISYPGKPSTNILGYAVDLIARIGGGAIDFEKPYLPENDNELGLLVEKRDYFDHCNPITDDDHKLWYCMYGYIVDEINKADAVNTEQVMVRCFPLRICGYDHFLQVLVRPKNMRAANLHLPDVFPDREPAPLNKKNGPIYLPILKECLRELIVQMHIAAFQRYVADEFDKPGAKPSSAAFWREAFAKHAPNLVRMTEVWIDEGKLYTYATRDPHKFEKWAVVPPGSRERPAAGAPHIVALDGGRIRVHVPWEDDFSSLDPLLQGTGQQRLEEQWEWLMGYARRWKHYHQLKGLESSLHRLEKQFKKVSRTGKAVTRR